MPPRHKAHAILNGVDACAAPTAVTTAAEPPQKVFVKICDLKVGVFRPTTRYARNKKGEQFTMDELTTALEEDRKILNVLLSNLRKKGWLEVQMDEGDARKRIYRLKNPEQVVEAMS